MVLEISNDRKSSKSNYDTKKKKPLLCGILVYQEKGTVGSNGLSGHHWPLRMQSDTFRKVSSNTGIDGLVDIGLCRNLGWNRSANMPTT